MARFGKRLREVRLNVGISQEKLADMARLHRTYVSSLERGRCNVSLVNIERLAIALKVSMGELMPDNKSKGQSSPAESSAGGPTKLPVR